ncbi:MAG: hypothetical protein QNJ12_16635 [Ilumatobacter sp.]|uniref:hypothetical protein n=1 Tax=Ilumatobacter sp. TaxID=1967498 RepID=UPI00261D510F|nr:hypothetical protein [Ilumatobacter sp.]MDJ0770424.1 hypothetical protein [Ilumatobacter sp.]
MKRLSRIIGATALVMMATAGPAMAAGNQPLRTLHIDESVLALDNGRIFPTPEEPLDCPAWAEWVFFSNGTGQMHHLGHFEMALTQCSHFPMGPPVGYSEGTTTFTAANGDMLVLAHILPWEIIFSDLIEDEWDGFEGEGTWVVDHGTGRFANASGEGTILMQGDIPSDDTPLFDLPPGSTLWTFTGDVEYRPSDRSTK